MSTRTQDELPEQLQQALNHGLLKRLPITFLPFTRQQLRDWPFLFPYERQSILRLLLYLAGLTDDQLTATFSEVVQLEEKMGVRAWQFSSNEQTILNASLLARSPFYQDWRRAVQKVFDAAEQHAPAQNADNANVRRCILLVLPRALPVDPTTIWQRWQGIGQPMQLDALPSGETRGISELLLDSNGAGDTGSLLRTISGRPNTGRADTWILDAGQSLIDYALKQAPAMSDSAILLSHARLATFRERFSHEMNTMRKDLEDADAVYDRLRKTDVTPWCPAEVASQPVLREFLRSLYLSGNGALLFGNSFVEWGASEAFRRARPSLLLAQFGVRSRPKPFTSVVVFENQDEINPLPAVDDLPGSALDAQVLALYVWLAATRYNEYQRNTVCLCLAESISQAYV
ncbi:MAG TPA: hypothetical protein VEJ47_22570, partial [Candidatus Eremiobacteraceae bacterium]|nr:hypothetical protein [Candidatus Eremiobacteraceae bacterium]